MIRFSAIIATAVLFLAGSAMAQNCPPGANAYGYGYGNQPGFSVTATYNNGRAPIVVNNPYGYGYNQYGRRPVVVRQVVRPSRAVRKAYRKQQRRHDRHQRRHNRHCR